VKIVASLAREDRRIRKAFAIRVRQLRLPEIKEKLWNQAAV
jgi:hypothetical protein